MPKTVNYGIFGSGEIEIDDDGFIEIPVIIQESGLFIGSPPAELRITDIDMHDENDYNMSYVAKLNEHADLPYYLATAKVKVDRSSMKKWTIDDLKEIGIDPL